MNCFFGIKKIIFCLCLVCGLIFISGCEQNVINDDLNENANASVNESINDTIGEIVDGNVSRAKTFRVFFNGLAQALAQGIAIINNAD